MKFSTVCGYPSIFYRTVLRYIRYDSSATTTYPVLHGYTFLTSYIHNINIAFIAFIAYHTVLHTVQRTVLPLPYRSATV